MTSFLNHQNRPCQIRAHLAFDECICLSTLLAKTGPPKQRHFKNRGRGLENVTAFRVARLVSKQSRVYLQKRVPRSEKARAAQTKRQQNSDTRSRMSGQPDKLEQA